ncbi:MAG: T9SS type A sorting domain-containing protein [Bacteroidetes bacterium]|nr:T9SS type A sorting domain-containing protein [Bacteroidota bacterium]
MKRFYCSIAFLLFVLNIYGATKNWVGGTGDWNVGSNWTPTGVPVAADDVNITTGTATIPGGFSAVAKSLTIGGSLTINGSLVIAGATGNGISLTGSLTVNAGLEIYNIGGNGIDNNGTITVSTAGSILIYSITAIGLINQSGKTITNSGGINIQDGVEGLSNAGTINNNGGSVAITSVNSSNSGIMNHTGSSLFYVYWGTFTNSSGGELTIGSGCIFVIAALANLDNNGILTNNGSIEGTTISFTQDGTYKGTGDFQCYIFTNSVVGTIAPGNSTGCATFNSDFINEGTMSMEVNGTTACTDFDRITVIGTFTAGGTLNLNFGSYIPTVGQTFTFIIGGSFAGSFAAINETPATIVATYLNGIITITESPLPVELIAFTAKENNRTVRLDWQTASEQNNLGFEVQRSADGERWNNLAFVTGHGTTQAEQSYTYIDGHLMPGTNYYRLQQVDFDGQFDYSQVVSVVVGREVSGISLFPNPATGTFTLVPETNYVGEATLTLFGLTGIQMERYFLSLEGEVQQFNLDLSNVPSGIYFVELTTSSERWRQRLAVK